MIQKQNIILTFDDTILDVGFDGGGGGIGSCGPNTWTYLDLDSAMFTSN